MPRKPNYLWVVETKDGGRWIPTVGVGFTREEARTRMYRWRCNNPNDRYRLRRYYAEEA